MSGDGPQRSNPTILFNASKNEVMKLNGHLRSLHRKLKGSWKILINMDEITLDILSGIALFVIPGPTEKFTDTEFNAMKKYIENGGSILVLLGEGGERAYQTNINFLLEEYGIMVNSDVVVRTHYYKYFYPKECLVVDGVLNRSILIACGKTPSSSSHRDVSQSSNSLSFVYPFGATLNVAKPAVALLSSGSVAYPLNRPVCAVYSRKRTGSSCSGDGGKLAVIGSVHFLADTYIDKEDNEKLRDAIFRYLTTSDIPLNHIDAETPEINDYVVVPDIGTLAERPRVCMQEPSDDIPSDYTKLFDKKLYSIHTGVLPDSLQAFTDLKVKHETLHLISPQFITPLPTLRASVFPPSFQDLPPPGMELFDLDEAFSSERARLSQLANKFLLGGFIDEADETDLEFFILECGRVLSVQVQGTDDPDAKQILHQVCCNIAEFKKLSHGSE